MTKVAGVISQALFQANIKLDTVAPLADVFNLRHPLNFEQVSNVEVINGTFVTENNYLYLFQGLANVNAPEWMIIVCDGQMNLVAAKSQSGAFFSMPVNRFSFLSWQGDAFDFLSSIYIDGRTSSPIPMSQGATINYTIIMGRGRLI